MPDRREARPGVKSKQALSAAGATSGPSGCTLCPWRAAANC